MKVNQLKAGVLLSYATQGIQVISGLLYTPIMLRILGQSEYGIYQLVNSVVSYLGLLSFGFGSGYIRFYSRYKAKNDEKGIAKINGMFIVIFSVIAVICIICGVAMLFNMDAIFGNGLTIAEKSKAQVLLAMMVFNMAISFVGSVFSSYITAYERFLFQRLLGFFRTLFNPFLALPLLLLGYGSVGMVIVSTVLTVLVFIADIFYCFKKTFY